MTNFLPAGIINDSIKEICEKLTQLKEQLAEIDDQSVLQSLNEVEKAAVDLSQFINQFSCEPLIYTGRGTTDEIISRLEWALVLTEEIDPLEYMDYDQKRKKSSSK